MTVASIETKVKEYKELQRMQEELNAELETLKDELKAELETRGTDTITTNEYKISYKTVTSNRFDTTAFKKTHSELYNQYTKTTTSKRFTVA